MNQQKGLVHVYTGDGKGKTTAALGLCVRACGAGKRVLLVQFLKGKESAELEPLKKLGVEILRTASTVKFVFQMNEQDRSSCRREVKLYFDQARSEMTAGKYDLVVLDEIFGAVDTGMLDQQELLDFLDCKDLSTELVLTGRNAPKDVCERADYISEIMAKKHPFERGVQARYGIEY